MTKKIFGSLKNGQVIIFDESYKKFREIEKVHFSPKDLEKQVPFLENIHARLKEDEMFCLDVSEEDEKLILKDFPIINKNSTDFNEIQKEEYRLIKAVYLVDDDQDICTFKRVFPKQHIKAQRILLFDSGPSYEVQSNIISLDENNDIFYDKRKRKFYFNKFNTLKAVFPEVIRYYQDASDEEIKSFLPENKFYLDPGLFGEIPAGSTVRKEIKLLIEDKNIDPANEESMKYYEEYGKKYGIEIPKKNGKYNLSQKEDLESLVDIFGERFQETEITKQKRIVENYRKLDVSIKQK